MKHQSKPFSSGGTALALLAYSCFCILYIWKAQAAGMTFPVPWPDESAFLWQAIAFQEFNHLFAPQLDASRDIMWMPPGYALVMGTIFKITGFSLETARTLSALFVILSMGFLLLTFSRHRALPWITLFIGISLLSSGFVLAGNFARMEAPLLLIVTAGTILLSRGHWYPGLALIFLSPIMHPNGLHFCLVVGIFVLIRIWQRDKGLLPRRIDYGWIALLLGGWLAYAIYITLNWDGFVTDMQFQMSFKNKVLQIQGPVLERLTLPHNLFPLMVVLPSLLCKSTPFLRALQLISFSLLSLNYLSAGLMYRVFEVFAVLIGCLIGLMLLSSLSELKVWSVKKTHGMMALFFFVAVAGMIHWKYVERSLLSPSELQVGPIKANPAREWAPDNERQTITRYLREVDKASDKPVWILFLPVGDSLLFRTEESEGLRFLAKIFERTPPDIIISHKTTALPEFLAMTQTGYAAAQVGSLDFLQHSKILYEDEGGARWKVFDLRSGTLE